MRLLIACKTGRCERVSGKENPDANTQTAKVIDHGCAQVFAIARTATLFAGEPSAAAVINK
jgi:hypothetical protein